MSNYEDDLYLTSDSESDYSDYEKDYKNVPYGLRKEVNNKPSPIKLNNVHIWESNCYITVSPIVSSTYKQKLRITIPTMIVLGRKRIQNVFDSQF